MEGILHEEARMDGSNFSRSAQILSSVMHHIDLDNQKVHNVPISATAVDLQRYLVGLLTEIGEQPNRRLYSSASPATEFSTCITSFTVNPILTTNNHADRLAERLLREELSSISRHPNLNPVAKGSFLQFTYKDGNLIRYLGVKIEHSTYIDVNVLMRRSGLAEDRKLYKAVSLELLASNYNDIHVFDTNGTPAVYWWRNFLELAVQKSDAENTKTAIEAVIKALGTLKKDHPSDHSLLRNAAIAAFKQKKVIRFDNFVDDLLSSYEPIDPQAKTKLATIESKLKHLPSAKKFDTQFSLDPSAVPYRQRKIILSPEISLTISEGIDNLADKVWASKTAEGQNILIIQTENIEGFEFKG